MSEPIRAGDMAEVINGLGRGKSPNLGLVVRVVSLQGEHSQHGRVWRCEGKGLKQLGETGDYTDRGWADFPATWLRKIEPDAPPPTATTTNKEVTA